MFSVSPFKKPVFMLPCPPLGAVGAHICRKITFDRIIILSGEAVGSAEDMKEVISEIAPEANFSAMGITGASLFIKKYREAVEKYCEDNIDIFGLPQTFCMDCGEKCKLPVITYGERLVHEHSGLSFSEIAELDVLDYRMLLADAVKFKVLNRADGKGKEFLNECYDFMHRKSNLFD